MPGSSHSESTRLPRGTRINQSPQTDASELEINMQRRCTSRHFEFNVVARINRELPNLFHRSPSFQKSPRSPSLCPVSPRALGKRLLSRRVLRVVESAWMVI